MPVSRAINRASEDIKRTGDHTIVQSETKSHVEQLTSPAGHPVTALRFEGDIASTSKEAVLGTYQALPKGDVKLILLDFTKVDYINSSGIALVIQMLIEAPTPARPSTPSASRRTSSKSSPWSASPSTPASSHPRPMLSRRCNPGAALQLLLQNLAVIPSVAAGSALFCTRLSPSSARSACTYTFQTRKFRRRFADSFLRLRHNHLRSRRMFTLRLNKRKRVPPPPS